MTTLRVLRLSNNPIERLPIEMHKLTSLQMLSVDGLASTIQYPPATAIASTESIMTFLCQQAGVPYHPPLLSPQPSPSFTITPSSSLSATSAEDDKLLAIHKAEQERISHLMQVGA